MVKGSGAVVCKQLVGEHSLHGYGPAISVKRLVRTLIPGGVGAGEEPQLPD